MMRSLKTRLLAGMVAGMVALLATFGMAVYVAVHRSLVSAFHASLFMSARAVAGQVEQKNDRVLFEYADLKMPEFERPRHPHYFQIWNADGTVLARSPSMGKAELPLLSPIEGKPMYSPTVLPNGRKGRIVEFTTPARVEDDGKNTQAAPAKVTIAVARDSAEMEEQLEALCGILLGGSAGMIALALAVAWGVVHRGLAPVDRLAREIAAIDADQLGARVAVQDLPAEMSPVAHRLNDLLKRLEDAFGRERSFTADVAHELRTPLAGLYSVVEFALARPREQAQYQEAFADCLGIAKNMRSMVDNLLMLARLDAGQIHPYNEAVAVANVIDECWRLHAPKADARNIAFQNALPTTLEVQADRGILLLVVSNLLANAAEYVNDGGQVRVELSRERSTEICFSNTGCGLTQEQVIHVFERFQRGDVARTSAGVHCGLGLALVQRAMLAIGGQARAAILKGGVFAIWLTFPA